MELIADGVDKTPSSMLNVFFFFDNSVSVFQIRTPSFIVNYLADNFAINYDVSIIIKYLVLELTLYITKDNYSLMIMRLEDIGAMVI